MLDFRSECLVPGEGGGGRVVNIWPLGRTEFANSQQGAQSLELTDVKPYVMICDRALDFVH